MEPGPREQVLLAASAALGLVVGSFLNVCIFRLPRNCMSIRRPRSRCPGCLKPIAWFDNLPVVSWLLLRGRCRTCGTRISFRYPAVELLTGALFFLAAWRVIVGDPLGGTPAPADAFDRAVLFAVHAWFVSALVVCTFIDLDLRILPDEVTLSGVVIGLAAAALFPVVNREGHPSVIHEPHLAALAASALGAFVGGGTIYVVGKLGKLAFRKEAMGFGDVKFMAMVGAVLGWRGVLLTFVVACLLGSLFGVAKLVAVRRMGYVPFGPFLSAGSLVMLFAAGWVEAVLRWYMGLFQAGGPLPPM